MHRIIRYPESIHTTDNHGRTPLDCNDNETIVDFFEQQIELERQAGIDTTSDIHNLDIPVGGIKLNFFHRYSMSYPSSRSLSNWQS